MRTTRIRIKAIHSDIPAKMYLQKFLLLRTCEKVGDEEVVNNYQLGQLNEAKRNGQIDFVKVNNMGFKDYIVTYIAKSDATKLLHTRCFRATDVKDAIDAFDAYFGGGEPMKVVSITEKDDKLTNNEIDICTSILDSVKMYSYWNEELGKYEFNGELATMVFNTSRMGALVLAIEKIANLKK